MYFHDKSHFQCYAAPHVAECQEPLPQPPVPLLVPHTFTLEQTCYSYSHLTVGSVYTGTDLSLFRQHGDGRMQISQMAQIMVEKPTVWSNLSMRTVLQSVGPNG